MESYWWIAGIVPAIATAMLMLINEHLKIDGKSLVLYGSATTSLTLLPVMLIIKLPSSPLFYFVTIGAGVLATIADSITFNSSAKFGAGLTTRVLPMAPIIGFTLWLFTPLADTDMFIHGGMASIGVATSLLGGVIALSFMRKCKVTSSAIVYILPAVIIYGINDVLNKTAQDSSALVEGVLTYIFVITSTMVVCSLIVFRNSEIKILDKSILYVSIFFGFIYIVKMVFRCFSMALTPNPGLTSMLGLTAPVFIYIWHKVRGTEEKNTNIMVGMVFVFCTMLMVYFTSLLMGGNL